MNTITEFLKPTRVKIIVCVFLIVLSVLITIIRTGIPNSFEPCPEDAPCNRPMLLAPHSNFVVNSVGNILVAPFFLIREISDLVPYVYVSADFYAMSAFAQLLGGILTIIYLYIIACVIFVIKNRNQQNNRSD
jgi:hypothetical protein